MRDLTFTGLKAHPAAVLVMFILAASIFCYGWFDISATLSQSQLLTRETFLTMINDRTNGKGYLLSAIFTLLLCLYALGSYRVHVIYRMICYVGLALACGFGLFMALI